MVEFSPSGKDAGFSMGFAGDTMNTAWYLKRCLPQTDTVDFLTAVGTDRVSDQMIAFLEQAGIGTTHILRRHDRTVGLYIIQLDNGERSFSYWRSESAARTLACADVDLASVLAGATMAYFSWITLAILGPQDRTRLLQSLSKYRDGGGIVAFDPNLRARLWVDATDMTDTVTQAAAVSDIILPSFDDEAAWFLDPTPEDTAKRYANTGARLVVVKNGSGPILVRNTGIVTRHEPTPVANVVDTTAAGDSFNAGFLAGHRAGLPIAETIRAAANLAAQVVQCRGALMAELDVETRHLVDRT